ncbi:MAG: N-acetylneuraminate synthase family protein [Gaiellaceae bacterium]
MKLAGRDTDERVLMIAEIGQNHEGDLGVARKLVEEAARAGADAVKFQTFHADDFVSPRDAERLERMRRFELPAGAWSELASLARERGLLFISTPLDLGSVDVLDPLVDAFKVASGDNDFFPLLDRIAETGKPTIVSSGLADAAHMRSVVTRIGGEVAVLHCVSAYPVEPAETALGGIADLAHELDCTVGYSDHTVGIEIAPLAVAAGARIIEKHFTLDNAFSEFRDHALSADPQDFAELVRRIREVEALFGPPRKVVQPSELANFAAFRRSIAAAHDLPEGHVVGIEDLTWLRPGDGLRPGEEELLVGRALRRTVVRGEQIHTGDVVDD